MVIFFEHPVGFQCGPCSYLVAAGTMLVTTALVVVNPFLLP